MSLQDAVKKIFVELEEHNKLAVERLVNSVPNDLAGVLNKYVEQGKSLAFSEAIKIMKEILHEQELDQDTD
jgi:hypothetical protein